MIKTIATPTGAIHVDMSPEEIAERQAEEALWIQKKSLVVEEKSIETRVAEIEEKLGL